MGHELEKFVLGEFEALTLIYEEKLVGGIEIGLFLEFCSWFHVRALRRGDQWCVVWGNFVWGAALWCGVGLCPKGRGGYLRTAAKGRAVC
jgi:hypothetical protein